MVDSAIDIFSWSAFVLGSIFISMTGFGKSIFSSSTGFCGSQSVSPVRVSLRPEQSDDVAGEGFLDLFAVGGMHQVHAADALFLVARGVGQRHAAVELARVDAAERDRADVLEAHDLEGEQRQRIFVDRLAQHRLAGLGIDALERFAIGGRGQEVDDGVEQRLHALVLERRAAHHRIEGGLDGRLADQPAQRLLVGLLALEVGLHGLVFHLDGGLDHGGAILVGALLEVGGDLLRSTILASLPSPSQT